MDRDAHKERVKAQFGAAAEAYVSSRSHAAGPDLAQMVALSGATRQSRVLDVATGGGHTALAFAAVAGEVVASDLTERMLEKAAEFIRSKGFENVRFAVADAESLPFADASFDIVTCRIAPHHFSNLGQAVREFARVLKPGGRLLIVDNIAPDDPELDRFINLVEKLRDPTHVRSYTAAEWRAVVAAVGLTVTHLSTFSRRHDYPDWVRRAAVAPEVEQELARLFRTAPESVRSYYRVVTDGDQVVSFTADTMLLAALR